MSSSAFTPSTTTVTNNVPVNVPVVTAWEAYTPNFLSDGTAPSVGNGILKGQWRRIGNSAEVQIELTAGSTTTYGSGFLRFSLPSQFTPSASFIGNGQLLGFGQIYNGLSTTQNVTAQINSITGSPVDFYWVSDSGLVSPGSPIVLGTTTRVKFSLFYEVAQWSGSGTTTLATRAVEEYAWNSDTGVAASATYSNSSFFGNGPNGTPFLSINSTTGTYSATRYLVRFNSPILTTDSLSLEIFRNGQWHNSANYFVKQALQAQFIYGPFLEKLSGLANTDIYVSFGNGGIEPGSFYGVAGTPYSSFTDLRWRVRKVSSGAQVGYPVSARNIVGDTSGSVVPVGMLGERITWATTPVTQALTTTEADWTNAVINLTPGTWQIFANIQMTYDCSAVAGAFGRSEFKVTDSSNNLIQNLNKQIATRGNASFVSSVLSASGTVTISSNTSYKIRVLRSDLTGTNSGNVLNTITAFSEFYAVRIA